MEPVNQTPQENPYNFIMQSPQRPKRSLLGGSMKSRIFIVLGMVVLLVIIGSIVSAILASAGQTTARNLKDVIAKQQELIRVSDMGAKDGLSVDTRNFAKTVNLTLQTDQAHVVDMLSRNGGELTAPEQNAAKDSRTDSALEAARANNQYDTVLTDTLARLLQAYLTALKTAHDATDGPNTKEILSASYANASTLLAPSQTAE